MARLRRSDCSGPGIRRRGRGKGFSYLDEGGRRIGDPETVARLNELRIPPAWRDVWICSDPMGHLQATGIDAAGRKQYLYHERWRQRRDQQKFDEMLEFARALPRLRRRVGDDLGAPTRTERRSVMACAVRLLDRGFFRIGSEDYAESNETYGLATMHRSHVTIAGTQVHFAYKAKGGVTREQTITDADVIPVLQALTRRRSAHPELLAFKEGRRWVDVRSDDVNAYIKGAARGDFSAKDFRTWHATVLAALALAAHDPPPRSKAAFRRAVNQAVAGVATFLGNTPAVCRRSYIDPRVIDRFGDGAAISRTALRAGGNPLDDRSRRGVELAVLRLIED
ncbi:MAG: DNA topoisomerase IB [Solirubrobacterales bacterium]